MQQYITEEQGDRQIVSTTTEANNPKDEPTREQLLAAYEGRYKQAILDSGEDTATVEASTNYSYLLESEGLSALADEDLIAYSDKGQAPLYLGMPVSARSEGFDLANGSLNRPAASNKGDGDEATPENRPLRSGFDDDLLEEIRGRGGAVTIAEAAPHAGASMEALTGADHPEHGFAFYRYSRGHKVLALAGATDSDLSKATNRADADLIGARFEGMLSTVEKLADNLVARLQHLGGSSSLQGAISSLVDLGHPRQAVSATVKELHRRDAVRVSVRGMAPERGQRDARPRFISLTSAKDGALAKAAKLYAEDCKEIPGRKAEAKVLRIKDGQDKGFAAPFVPFKEQNLDPIEQRRALYIERAKALYNGAAKRGVGNVTITLAAFCTLADGKEYPVIEDTLYEDSSDKPSDFFRARVKARILTGVERNGCLSARKIVTTLFPEKAAEIISLLDAQRPLSPQLSEPYNLFREAVGELVEEGKVRHTRKAIVAADPEERRSPAWQAAWQVEATDPADEAPEPEAESGPDPSGEDRYAADMAGAHDGRNIATGPQAPARNPRQRKRAAGRVSAAVEKARSAKDAPAKVAADTLKAECNRAWHEALESHMAALDEADRLELMLQVRGPQYFERMVDAATEPHMLFKAARELLDCGRLAVEQGDHRTRISATGELDRDSLSEALVEVIAAEEIAVPEGTSLAERVNARNEAAAVSSPAA